MDAFESVVAAILQRQGYWTITSAKVELSKKEKREIGRHSNPRWELDIVAYRGNDNSIRVIECKSYLDSTGVNCKAFAGSNIAAQDRYKLFFDDNLRNVVFRSLKKQLVDRGFCAKNPKVQLCLAAGKIDGDETWLGKYFDRRGWLLWGPGFIRQELSGFKDSGYENSVAAIVTKLLLRDAKTMRVKRGVDAAV